MCSYAQSQHIDSVFTKACTAYTKHEYQQAILEFKRIQYFDALYKTDSIHTMLAHAYFACTEYEQALFHYSQVENANTLRKASCYILTNQYELAQTELYTYTHNGNEPIVDYYMLQACLNLQTQNLDSAYYYAQKLLEYTQDSSLVQVHESFSLLEKKFSQSLIFPQIASAIIPGLGLELTGHTKQGLRSFAVVSGLALAFTGTAYSYSVFDACISIAPWFIRYYVGQIKNVNNLHQLQIDELRYTIFLSLMNAYEASEQLE